VRNATFYISTICLALGLLAAQPRSADGQEAPAVRSLYDTTGVFVYTSFNKVPWSRVDSLIQLNRMSPTVRDMAIEMGCYLDRRMMIHHTGTEFNVVVMTSYPTWQSIMSRSGCGGRAFRAAVPDSALRRAINEGNNWVFGENEHRDIIYWEPYPR